MQKLLTERLNSMAKIYRGQFYDGGYCEEKENSVIFYNDSQLKNVLLNVAPYLKVAIFSCKTTFLKSGRQVIENIKKFGNKVVNYIVPDDFSFSVSSACGAFNLAEDVRAVIVLDVCLFELANYFATIRGIDVIFASEFNVRAFESSIDVINGDNIDTFKLNTNRHIILDRIDYSYVYAQLSATLFSVIEDFFAGNEEDKLDKATKIEQVLKDGEQEEMLILLVEYYLDKLLHQELIDGSFLRSVQRLLGHTLEGERALCAVKYLLKSLTSAKNTLLPPDYNGLAQSLHKFSAENFSKVVEKINAQVKFINSNASEFSEYVKFILDFAKNQKENFEYYQKKCLENGGRKVSLNKREKFAIKNAGAFSVNAATVLREIQ